MPDQQNDHQESLFSAILKVVARGLLLYSAINYFRGSSTQQSIFTKNTREITNFEPYWKFGDVMDIQVYFSENPNFDQTKEPSWVAEGITYGNYSHEIKETIEVPISKQVQRNASLYAHVTIYRRDSTDLLHQSILLTHFMRRKRDNERKSLLSQDYPVAEKEDPSDVQPIVSYWWPNMTVNMVAENGNLPIDLHPLVRPHLKLTDDQSKYLPIVWNNDFWMLRDHLILINETTPLLNLTIQFYHLPMWKFQFYKQFSHSLSMQHEMMGVQSSETDELKRMFLETNPILLGVTFFVSLLHSLFDFLAFKNDIQFWRQKKDMEGLSFRTILLNVFFQFVIFLYLLDNETSWMILVSSGVGLLIEIWKISRTAQVNVSPEFPFVVFKNKVSASAKVSETQKYDEIAFQYLSFVLYPLLFCYAIYSILYETHKSWYSFVIGTLVGFVYMFGFISMTPQLYINYRLKSVAHMPWKTFMYKALNTFVDDLFAFVIKMPTLHRLACLRDDVIFIVYLYQRWIYVEDKTRANEYGQVGEDEKKTQ